MLYDLLGILITVRSNEFFLSTAFAYRVCFFLLLWACRLCVVYSDVEKEDVQISV